MLDAVPGSEAAADGSLALASRAFTSIAVQHRFGLTGPKAIRDGRLEPAALPARF